MKIHFLKFTIIFLLLNGMLACSEEKENCEPFVLIGQSHLSGDEGIPQQNIVINTQEEWECLIENIGEYKVQHIGETDIDFDNYQIIAVFDKGLLFWRFEY